MSILSDEARDQLKKVLHKLPVRVHGPNTLEPWKAESSFYLQVVAVERDRHIRVTVKQPYQITTDYALFADSDGRPYFQISHNNAQWDIFLLERNSSVKERLPRIMWTLVGAILTSVGFHILLSFLGGIFTLAIIWCWAI